MKKILHIVPVFSFCLLMQGVGFAAVTVPFQEDFTFNSANWTNFDRTAGLTYNATGGPDGSSYASGTFNFMNSTVGTQGPVILRGETTSFGTASGGNFIGNWIADGVREFRAFVRHNATVPLTFYTRFADPNFFPGASAVEFTPIAPNTWTELVFGINPSSPNFVSFEGQSFETTFDSIARLQFSVSIPTALAGVDQEFTFDIDQVAINAPEPTTLWLGCLGALAVLSKRRRSDR